MEKTIESGSNKVDVDELVRQNSGIHLDIGCGKNKQPNFVGMDARDLPGVDIVHNWNDYPWPLPDESCLLVMASHVVEHVNPADGGFIRWMDEVWRILKVGGKLIIACPHGSSQGYLQDPTHCLLDGSEVLTSSGFKRMQDVGIGEQVLTLRLEDGVSEYAPCAGVFDVPYSGDILHFKNRAIDIAVTPNHDLVWRTWQPIKGYHKGPADSFLGIGDFARRGLRTITDWSGDEDTTGDFMELLGWILSEGSFIQRGNYRRIAIHQSADAKPENYERVTNLLIGLGYEIKQYPKNIQFKDDAVFDELSSVGKSHERYIPIKYKNQNVYLLGRLIESLLLGDGEKHPNGGGHTYTTVSKQLADDVQEIALKCGMEVRVRKRAGGPFVAPNGKTYTRRDQYRVSITDNRPMLYPQPEIEHYDGNITCVQVANNGTIFTRYNGHAAWTGNCNPCNEATWVYFTPLEGVGLYDIYEPKPWFIENLFWNPSANIEVTMVKVEEKTGDESGD